MNTNFERYGKPSVHPASGGRPAEWGTSSNARRLSPEEVIAICRNPELRMADHPEVLMIAQQLITAPDDPHLQELFALALEQLASAAMIDDDPYRSNYPPKGTLT